MKNPTALLGILAGFVAATPAMAKNDIEIESLKRDRGHLYVDDQWVDATRCISMRFRVSRDMESRNLVFRAYFFDKDKKIVNELKNYSSWTIGNGESIKLPFTLKSRDAYEVPFGIPKRLEDSWYRVVIVVEVKGVEDSKISTIYPSDKVEDYPIPAK